VRSPCHRPSAIEVPPRVRVAKSGSEDSPWPSSASRGTRGATTFPPSGYCVRDVKLPGSQLRPHRLRRSFGHSRLAPPIAKVVSVFRMFEENQRTKRFVALLIE